MALATGRAMAVGESGKARLGNLGKIVGGWRDS